MKHRIFAIFSAVVIFSVACVLNACTNPTSAATATQPSTTPPTNCYQNIGINLAGAEFNPEQHPTNLELKYYHDKKVRIIRLPLQWKKLQPTFFGELDPEELKWLKSLIHSANDMKMSIIVDIHNFQKADDLQQGSTLPASSLADLWEKLAGSLRTDPGICGYDLANEPGHDVFTNWTREVNRAIKTIRRVDNTHYVFIGETAWDHSKEWNATDAARYIDSTGRIVYAAHSYWDDDESGKYTSAFPANTDPSQIAKKNLSPFVNWCTAVPNRKCFVGEFGVPPTPNWLTALSSAISYLKQNDIGGAYWAGGPWPNNYDLSIEPLAGGVDSPQMKIMEKFL